MKVNMVGRQYKLNVVDKKKQPTQQKNKTH